MKMDDNIFRSLRKRKGLSQKELADILGLQNAAVSKWETGRTLPESTILLKLADFYNVSVDQLLGREPLSALFDDARIDSQKTHLIPAVARSKDNKPGVRMIEVSEEQYQALMAIVNQNREEGK